MRSFRIQFPYFAAFCCVCAVANAVDWNITLPNEEDDLWTQNSVECQGVGYSSADYELRIRQGTLILAQTANTTNEEGDMVTHEFTTPTNGWPVGAAVVEVSHPGFPITLYADQVNVECKEVE